MTNQINQRIKKAIDLNNLNGALYELNVETSKGNFNNALDIIEQLIVLLPEHEVELLVKAYDIYQSMPNNQTRYSLYQSRHYDFVINPTDKVMDIGSGHMPFPFATHLADIATEDDNYGRAGAPFKFIAGKPVYSCGVEHMPFEDKSFDFIYCSHVLEHVADPIQACKELMRVAKKGYLETPSQGKDLFLNTAKISNHFWKVEYFNNFLTFTEYDQNNLASLDCNILMSMHCNPQTDREKAFSALIYLKSDQVNTMLMWENGFNVEVRRIGMPPEKYIYSESHLSPKANIENLNSLML